MNDIRCGAARRYGLARMLTVAIGVFFAASCTSTRPPNDAAAREETVGSALAKLACPYSIADASAWINMMPGPAGARRNLVVLVHLAEKTANTMLLRSPSSTPGRLVLELRDTEAAPIPGQVAYREPVADPPVREIALRCRGGDIYAIRSIERVY